MITRASPERLIGLQGTYAGFVTRLGGFLIDVTAIAVAFALAGQALDYILTALLGRPFKLSDAPLASGGSRSRPGPSSTAPIHSP